MKENGKLIIFSAPSGAGKTTIVKRILKCFSNLEFSISACSRNKRPGEIDGKDYYFLSAENFKHKIEQNEFVEWEEVYEGFYYGTLKSELERIWNKGHHVLFDVDVKGGIALKKIFGDNALAIFIKPPSLLELEFRLRNRETETEESIFKRISKAEFELTFAPGFDHIIVNDVLERAVRDAKQKVEDFLNPKHA